jgi:hypothetical protein
LPSSHYYYVLRYDPSPHLLIHIPLFVSKPGLHFVQFIEFVEDRLHYKQFLLRVQFRIQKLLSSL